jgi:N-dimethylarginine dimethylaminohydrolase
VVIGNTVLMPEGCWLLKSLLERKGYSVIPIPMSEFIKSGGACKCLVMFLER